MTARLPFTQAGVRRAIAAAHKAGLYVVAIRADGTVITGDNPQPLVPGVDADGHAEPSAKWQDVEA